MKHEILSQDFVNHNIIDKIFALIWRFVVSKKKKKKKKKGFLVFWKHFLILKGGLKLGSVFLLCVLFLE
ncbi:hypothetical protein HpKG101_13490 [Helicobacter pylori]